MTRVLKTGTEFANMKLHKRIDCSRAKGKRKAKSWGKSEIENHVVQIKNLFKRWWEENQLQGQEAKAKLRREARSNPEVHTQTEHEVLWKSHRDKIETSLLKKKKKSPGVQSLFQFLYSLLGNFNSKWDGGRDGGLKSFTPS